jgi:hypothetical protein
MAFNHQKHLVAGQELDVHSLRDGQKVLKSECLDPDSATSVSRPAQADNRQIHITGGSTIEWGPMYGLRE